TFGSDQGSVTCSRQARHSYVADAPGRIRRDHLDAAPPTATRLDSACDHLPDRSLAVGSPRADRCPGRCGDSTKYLQAMARRARGFAVAGDDADRFHRPVIPAVSAEDDRDVAAHASILDERLHDPSVREVPG